MIGEVLGEKPVIGVQRMGSAFSRSRASTERQALWDSWDLCDRESLPPNHVSRLTSHREKLSFHASHLSLLTVLIFT